MQIDATLGMIAAEVERSFERAGRALDRYRDGVAAADVLDDARGALIQARGVLEVANVAGVPRVLFELEQLIEETARRCAQGALDPALNGERLSRARAGLEAVRRYVAAVAAGALVQPMQLADALQDLMRARGSDRPAGLELMQVDLSRPLPAEADPGGGSGAQDEDVGTLRELRAVFQKHLLEWLRGGEGLRALGDVVSRVQAAALVRAPWWIAGAFIEQLQGGLLPATVHVKRVFAALDQYLAKLVSGGAAMPEGLMREMLYFVAQGEPAGTRVAQVRSHYRIVAPAVRPPAGAAPPPAAFADRFRALEALWEETVGGDAASAQAFVTGINALRAELPAALEPLLATLVAAAAAQTASEGAGARPALEAATALLMLEEAAAARDDGATLAARAQWMAQRVERALRGADDAQGPWSDVSAALDTAEPDDGLLALLGKELAAAFAEAERNVSACLAEPGNVQALAAAERALAQAHGVFQVLGDGHAAAATGYCLSAAARLRDVGQAHSEQAPADLAAVVSALTYYVEQIGRGDADLAELLHRAGAPEAVATPPQPPAAGAVDVDLDFFTPGGQDEAPESTARADAGAGDAAQPGGDDCDEAGDAELLPIFVDEADEVLTQLAAATGRLRARASDAGAMADIRRGFHTLKGSGRMVGLHRFAENAQALEKLLDAEIRRGAAAEPTLLSLLDEVLPRMRAWVDALRRDGRARIDGDDLIARAGRIAAGADERAAHREAPAAEGADDGAAERNVSSPGAGEDRWSAGEPSDAPAASAAADAPAPAETGELPRLDASPAPPEAESAASDSAVAELTAGESTASESTAGEAAQPEIAQLETAVPAGAGDAPTVEIGAVRLSQTLYAVFVDESRRVGQALAGELAAVDAVVDDAQAHERFRLAHTLCGIAGTTGFSPMHDLAGALETVLRGVYEHELQVEAGDRALFASVASALLEMVDAVAARVPPAARPELESALRALARRRDDASAAAQSAFAHEMEPEEDAGAEANARAAAPVGRALQAALKELAGQLNETGLLDVSPSIKVERRRLRMQDDLDHTLLPAFLEEAADLVPQVGDALRRWRAEPGQPELHQALTRLLHTFKGGARMAGAMALGELTHSMETRIATAARLPEIPDSVFDGLETSFDRMGVLLERIARPRGSDARRSAADDTAAGVFIDADAPDETTGSDAGIAGVPAAVSDAPAAARPMLRVRVDLLEQLGAQAGELAISRARVEGEVRAIHGAMREMASNIARLRGQVRELEIQAESQIQSRHAQASDADQSLDPLEFDRFTRLQELTRLVDESANDVTTLQQTIARNVDNCDSALATQARMTRILQDSLMSVRMVPFSNLNERLYRVVRLTARDAGRRASLDIRGSRVELDRSVVDRIAAPLEHLLRNAVVHGIEAPEERRAAGKPEVGEIVLEISQEGNEVLLTLQDDGRGLDLVRLHARAIEAGLIMPDARLSPDEIAQLAFAPGVSTARSVSESAGRGVGLDVVRSEVAAVGGRVEIAFEAQKGTTFSVRLPLTMTVMQALVVRCGGQLFALPALMVEQVRTLKPAALERVSREGRVDWQANRYPLHDLRELLALDVPPAPPQAFTPLALVRAGAQRAAIRIDELVAHEEVVIKDIGRQLSGITGIVGGAVRGSGEIVLILNPVRLAQRHGVAPAPRPPLMVSAGEALPALTVLVVDDSLTVRKITGRVLARRGYRVVEARDGLEALDRLAVDRPQLVLLDIEMPRMDGFEVLRRMRSDPRWQSVPVMMITSRTADKHRNVALELGASAFLGKPFEEQELLSQVSELIEQERV